MRRLLSYFTALLLPLVVVLSVISASPAQTYAAPVPAPAPVATPSLNCPVTVLSWAICPVVDFLVQVTEQIDNFINSELSVGSPGATSDPNQIFCDSQSSPSSQQSCAAFYDAWASMRDIALGLMAIAAMIVLISQALGFEFLDAYTIRKSLPRLLVAAFGITLSWPLMQFFVTFTNDLAFGIRFLIYAPFEHLHSAVLSGGGAVVGSLFSLAALNVLGIAGILSFGLTAALACIIGFIVIVLRQLLIIMLIIVAPIAIVSYILPHTQRVWKLWWESFSKALLMFALISAMIAIGRVFAVVNQVDQVHASSIEQLVGFTAYFLPYLLIPLSFRFAGGALRGIGGFVNDRSRGAFGGIKGYRSNVAKKNMHDNATGNRLHGDTYGGLMKPYGVFASNFNRATAGTANLRNAGYNPRRMRQRMSAARSTRVTDEAKEAMEKNQNVRQLTADDDLVEASLFASNEIRNGSTEGFESLVRQDLEKRNYHNVEQGVALIRSAHNSMASDSFDTAMGIAAFGTSSGLTPDYTEDPVTGETVITGGAAEGRAIINQVAGGDRQRAIQMLGAARQLAESKGRFDLAGGSFTEDAEILDDMHKGNLTEERANDRLLRGALDGTGRGRIFAGHRRNIDAMAPQVRNLLDESFGYNHRAFNQAAVRAADPSNPAQRAPGNPQEVIQQLAFAANSLDAASSNSAESARVFNDQVLSQQVNLHDLDPHVLNALGTITYAKNPQTGATLRDATGRPYLRDLNELGTNKNGVMTYGQIVEAMRNDEQFGRYRREYGRFSTEAAAANAAVAGAQPPQPPPQPGGAAGGGPGGAPSDKRLKRNVKYVTTLNGNVDLFSFQYIWSDQIYVGVMAQDLLQTYPEAVILYPDGFYRVDYSKLGLEMTTLEEFHARMDSLTKKELHKT